MVQQTNNGGILDSMHTNTIEVNKYIKNMWSSVIGIIETYITDVGVTQGLFQSKYCEKRYFPFKSSKQKDATVFEFLGRRDLEGATATQLSFFSLPEGLG